MSSGNSISLTPGMSISFGMASSRFSSSPGCTGHDDRYLDMWYEDTVSRPLEEIQRLYDFVGVDLTPEARAEMERWRDMNRREARPTHQYTLEEYGFTEEGLKNTFREYRERYILSRRPG